MSLSKRAELAVAQYLEGGQPSKETVTLLDTEQGTTAFLEAFNERKRSANREAIFKVVAMALAAASYMENSPEWSRFPTWLAGRFSDWHWHGDERENLWYKISNGEYTVIEEIQPGLKLVEVFSSRGTMPAFVEGGYLISEELFRAAVRLQEIIDGIEELPQSLGEFSSGGWDDFFGENSSSTVVLNSDPFETGLEKRPSTTLYWESETFDIQGLKFAILTTNIADCFWIRRVDNA